MNNIEPGDTTAPGVEFVMNEFPASVSSNITASPVLKLVPVTPFVQFTTDVSHVPFTYPFHTSFPATSPLPPTCNTRLFAFNTSVAFVLPLASEKFAKLPLKFVNVISV